jgi:hypothetical protein
MINEYDVVKLVRSVDGVPIAIGTRGTVLIVYNGPPAGFEVEFVDENGESLGAYTVKEDDIGVN